MENKTKVILGIALVVAVGMMLFPPEQGGGYDFIAEASGIDGVKLLVQLGALTFLTFLATLVTRKAAKIGGAIAVGAAILVIGVLVAPSIHEYYTETLPRQRVLIEIQHDTAACSDDFPLAVTVRNRSSRVVNSIGFDIAGRNPGQSSTVFRTAGLRGSNTSYYKWDHIVTPGRNLTYCWSVPESAVSEGTGLGNLVSSVEREVIVCQ